jgi:hypothetical protein
LRVSVVFAAGWDRVHYSMSKTDQNEFKEIQVLEKLTARALYLSLHVSILVVTLFYNSVLEQLYRVR